MPLGGGRSSGPGASYGDLAPAELHRAGSFPQWANTDPPASLAHHSVRAALLRARLPSARQRHSPVQANGSCVSSSRVGSMSNTNSSSGRSSGSSSRDGSASVLQYLMSLACNTAEGSAVDPLVGNGAAAAAAEAAAALGEDGGCGTGGKEGAMGGGVGAAVLEASAGGSSNSDSGELTRSCSSDCDTAFRQLYDSELRRLRGFLQSSLSNLWHRTARAAEALEQLQQQLQQAAGGQGTSPAAAAADGRRSAFADAAGQVAAAAAAVGGQQAAAAASEVLRLCIELRRECDNIGSQLVDLEAFERHSSAQLAEIGVQYDHDRAAATATVALAAAAAAPSNGAIDGPAAAAAVAAASPIGSPTVWAAVAAAAASPGPGVLGPIRADGLTGPSAAGSPQTRAGGGGGGGGSGGGGSSAKLLALGTLGVYQGCIREYLLYGMTYDAVLIALSDTYSAVRHAARHAGQAVGADTGLQQPWVPPDSFKRSTTKFWVDPRHVLRVKAAIVRHLPLLIYGRGAAKPTNKDRCKGTPLTSANGTALVVATPVTEPCKPPPPPTAPTANRYQPLFNGVLPPSMSQPHIPHMTLPTPPSQQLHQQQLPLTADVLLTHAAATAGSSASPGPAALYSAPPSPSPGAPPAAAAAAPAASKDPAAADLTSSPAPQLLSCASCITSVYFDNPQLDVYHERLVRGDGAALVRIRWYGSRSPAPGQGVFVERKRHRDAWTGEWSVKERAQIGSNEVPAFLAGRHVAAMAPPTRGTPADASAAKAAALLQEVQTWLVGRQQVPFLRTEYLRSAFQLGHTNEVRISLDTQLAMSREEGAPRPPGGWCRDGCAAPHPDDVVRFPYAVLEIKLQDEDSVPEWVLALRQSGLLVEAPKFSKFLHGMALLYPHRLRNTPHWFLPEPDSEDKGEPEAGPADDTAAGTGGAAAVGGWLARRGGSRWRGGAASRLLAPKRLGALGRLPPRMSPATLEELADPWDKYEQEVPRWLFPPTIRADQAADITPDEDAAIFTDHSGEHHHHHSQDTERGVHSKKSGSESDSSRRSSVRSSLVPTVITVQSAGPTVNGSTDLAGAASLSLAARGLQGSQGSFRPPGLGPTMSLSSQPRVPSPTDTNNTAKGATSSTSSTNGSDNGGKGGKGGALSGAPGPGKAPVATMDILVGREGDVTSSTTPSVDAAAARGCGGGGGGRVVAAMAAAGAVVAAATATGARAAWVKARGAAGYVARVVDLKQPGAEAAPTGQPKLQLVRWASDATSAVLVKGFNSSSDAASLAAASSGGIGAGGGGMGGGGGGGGPPPYRDVESGGGQKAAGPLPRAAALVRTRVEPKTFFAAERTFVSWLNIAVLVMFTSLSLMATNGPGFGGGRQNGIPQLPDATTAGGAAAAAAAAATGAPSLAPPGVTTAGLVVFDPCPPGSMCHSSQIAGLTMAPVALLFMLYALYMYRKRSAQILRREAVRYDDQRGPLVLTAMLVVVLMVSYALAMRAAMR